ncbi:hypothetical protein [Massilia litorea]|uniref:Uncharacterized protein n=1 Tax=Massilia litorea TaxID=2769491 RepID=A0A7L9UB11_9BURK|nr:hypothetical protein [Massilia litorea]QOL52251.1 hypothetical protein LPB04_23875 [Massilia litorea]
MSWKQRKNRERRTDLRTSMLIDAAINAVLTNHLIPVAEELIDQGIDPNLILRVLTRPAERRRYGELYESYQSLVFH